jgi:hypothetical protein
MGHKFAANILNFTYPGSGVTSDWVTDSGGALPVPTKAGMAALAILGGLGAGFVVCHKKTEPLENRATRRASE